MAHRRNLSPNANRDELVSQLDRLLEQAHTLRRVAAELLAERARLLKVARRRQPRARKRSR